MAEGHLVYRMCRYCDGTGIMDLATGTDPVVVTQVPCTYCGATGAIFWGWMTKDDETIPDNLPDVP